MEDILAVYQRPQDSSRPLVCMDECPKQLIGETRAPLPATPDHPERYDTEYVRNGTCEQFLFVAPYEGWRRVDVTERKTRKDWAGQVRKLVDEDFPQAEKIVLVMDNLNTHGPASLYEAFEPAEAKRIWDRLEIHHTPKHGSWLNMAEIELSVLNHHGLSERIASVEKMRSEISAWQKRRNKQKCKITWSFSIEHAREKMKNIYPRIQV
jgi:transposase